VTSELFIFARFHANEGRESAVASALREVIGPTRQEPGCLAIDAFESISDSRLFYIQSRWRDEAAFDLHTGLPHTVRFIEKMRAMIDHDLEVTRTRPLA
jgi:quinol monooxygenase YgiN